MSIFRASCQGKITASVQVQVVLMLTLTFMFLPLGEGAGCTKTIARQLLTYQNCVPKVLYTHSCVGSCVTHAQVSPTNPLVLEHTCYQCKEYGVKHRRVKVKCPNPEGPKRFKHIFIEVPIPESCLCQRCSPIDHIIDSSVTPITESETMNT